MKSLAIAARRVEGLSGAVSLILAEARAAVDAGWSVTIFAQRLDEVAIKAVGATPRRVRSWPWGSWLKRRLFAALAERQARDFDVVHGHGDLLTQDVLSLHNCVHAAFEAATGHALPANDAVGRMHALQLEQRRFRLLVANSKLMQADVERRFGVPSDSIAVAYPGYDEARLRFTDRISRGSQIRRELGLGVDQPLFGLVTSGDFEKRGVALFLRAFALAFRDASTARVLVVGKETRLGPYLDLCAELGIAQKVSFRPPRRDVESYYHALDAYVHAAQWEEFGMTVLEAMACGVPVICGPQVGAAELLSGESREYVLPNLTAETLATAMVRLAGEPSRRVLLSAANVEAAASHTLAAHGRQVVSFFDRLGKK